MAEGAGEVVTEIPLGGVVGRLLRIEVPASDTQEVWVLNEIRFVSPDGTRLGVGPPAAEAGHN